VYPKLTHKGYFFYIPVYSHLKCGDLFAQDILFLPSLSLFFFAAVTVIFHTVHYYVRDFAILTIKR